jgi:hypothetical protein
MLVISLDDTSKPNLLPYGITSSTPAISIPNRELFKSERSINANNYFEEKIGQLNAEYDRLVTLAKYTDLVYNSRYNFIPRVGEIYHLYFTGESYLLSMIEPERWNKYNFVASFRFTADNTWEKQDGQEAPDTTC